MSSIWPADFVLARRLVLPREVVPFVVELEVAVPRLTPVLR